MADGRGGGQRVRKKGFKRSHGISNITYGHFGTPSYHASTQQWTFQRDIAGASTTNPEDATPSLISLRRIHLREHEHSILSPSALPSVADDGVRFKSSRRDILKQTPDLIPAYPCIRQLERETFLYGGSAEEPAPATNQLMFGCTSYASSPRLAFLAAVSSRERSKISFWPVQLEKADASALEHDNDLEAVPNKVPVLGHDNASNRADSTWSAPLNEPILQLCHLPGPTLHMIAYRQSSSSTLCLPVVHDQPRHAGRLTMKQVLTLPLSRTGNHPHADIALCCSGYTTATGLRMAVVDVHGNYSVWDITGRRSLTTRLLYQARLGMSGKLWSWSESHSPSRRGMGSPYFDGWHKVCFLRPNSGLDLPLVLLLVANRQRAILLDDEGNECQNVDLRLESRFEWLLNIWPSRADPSRCIFLTSSKILLLQLESTGATSPSGFGSDHSLGLVCSASHFLSATSIGGRLGLLRISVLELANDLLVFIYSGKSPMVTFLAFHLDDDTALWTVKDLSSFFPFGDLNLETSAIIDLACLPIYGPDNSTLFVMLVAKHLDGRVTEALHIPSGLGAGHGEAGKYLIAPWPGSRRKVARSDRIIDMDDEEEFDDFVVDDEDDDDVYGYDASKTGQDEDPSAMKQRITGKDWSWIYAEVDDSEKRLTMSSALDNAGTQIQSTTELPDGARTYVLREIIPAFQVSDIEETESSLMDWREKTSTESMRIRALPLHQESESFARVYEQIMGKFVRTLSDRVGNRLRVNTERLSRQVAMDLALSSLIIDKVVQQPSRLLGEDERPSGSGTRQRPLSTSTTLDAAVSRLGKYTSFRHQWQPDQQTTSAMESILAHLPEDISTNPDQYSYSSIELDIARRRLQQAQDADPASKRRAERMEAIRRQRAEKAQTTGKITMSQETPIFVRGSSPASQGITGLNMTQPERGDFGTRPVTASTPGTRKKKKKRSQSQRAGF